jgi:hypothetical protein
VRARAAAAERGFDRRRIARKSKLDRGGRAALDERADNIAARLQRLAEERRMTFGKLDRVVARGAWINRGHWRMFNTFRAIARKLRHASARLTYPMKADRDDRPGLDLETMDRRIIRVDLPPTHAGITAALRRAFEAAASEPSDRDFAELLRRLN